MKNCPITFQLPALLFHLVVMGLLMSTLKKHFKEVLACCLFQKKEVEGCACAQGNDGKQAVKRSGVACALKEWKTYSLGSIKTKIYNRTPKE